MGLFPAKDIEVEVISEEIPESSGAICTGLQKGERLKLIFDEVLYERDTQTAMRVMDECRPPSPASPTRSRSLSGMPMAEGAFKYAYAVRRKATNTSFVLKAPKNFMTSDVWDDLKESTTAIKYANGFNSVLFGSKIRFCAPSVVKVHKARDNVGDIVYTWLGVEVLLEPMLLGEYSKFVYSSQIPRARHDLPQAYFHYTYTKSDKKELVWDLQGVDKSGLVFSEYHLTDPLVITDTRQVEKYFKALHTDLWGCNWHCVH